ncbi:hypothetical protein INT47_006917 [Mucor saturninus]|uniref:C2H2-type domain-containing protein n=1 Tax=Mucor saturninus TaxID=64648 RepID=A0A8H7QGC7_9FUNG|nr:hypothetical protein INT47_006917 [Mucor saturninus]
MSSNDNISGKERLVIPRFLTEVDIEDSGTVITQTLTCLKCKSNYSTKSALMKHLKVKHQTVIVGAKPGRPSKGGSLATYIRRQQKQIKLKSGLGVNEKKLMKQVRKRASYEVVKDERKAKWIALERKALLEDLNVLWDMSGSVWTADCAYVEYSSEVSPIYQFIITKLALEDSYGLRASISLSILEMMFERFPGVFDKKFDKEIVLEALTPLKFNHKNDKEQDNIGIHFNFEEVDCTETKTLLEHHRNCKDINKARLDIMLKLCFLIQVHFGAHDFDFKTLKVRSGFFCSLFASVSFDSQ